jgi:hypothetical protein
MHLHIQLDESLASYVRHNLLLRWLVNVAPVFEQLATRHVLKTIEVKSLAVAMDLPGCYGFNQLFQSHPMMAPTHTPRACQNVLHDCLFPVVGHASGRTKNLYCASGD